eukprot:1662797-Pyramimonas_sp.AAC.1
METQFIVSSHLLILTVDCSYPPPPPPPPDVRILFVSSYFSPSASPIRSSPPRRGRWGVMR